MILKIKYNNNINSYFMKHDETPNDLLHNTQAVEGVVVYQIIYLKIFSPQKL